MDVVGALDRMQIGVHERIAETPDETLHLGRGQVLVREEQGDVLEVGLVHRLGGLVVQLARQVDAEHLGPAGAAERLHLKTIARHECASVIILMVA